jgi:hypothetical protein
MAKATATKKDATTNASKKATPVVDPRDANPDAMQRVLNDDAIDKTDEQLYEEKQAATKLVNDVVDDPKEKFFILGAKILKDKVVIDFIERKANKEDATLDYENKAEPHEDFVNAMALLKPHLAIACRYIKVNDVAKIKDIKAKDLEEFKVTGFSMKNQDMEGFSISGGLTWSLGWVGLNAPYVRNINDPAKGYVFIADLVKAIEKCQKEALEYRNGKQKPKAQGDLFDGDNAEVTK